MQLGGGGRKRKKEKKKIKKRKVGISQLPWKLQMTADKIQVKPKDDWFLEKQYLASLHWEWLPHVLLADETTNRKTVHQLIVKRNKWPKAQTNICSVTIALNWCLIIEDRQICINASQIQIKSFFPNQTMIKILLAGMSVLKKGPPISYRKYILFGSSIQLQRFLAMKLC